jgi:hypothetical protein
VNFSSRHWDFKRGKWVFGNAGEEEMSLLLTRKVFWQTRVVGGVVWIADPTEALFVEASREHLLELARKLEAQGLLKLAGEFATASLELMDQAGKFEADARAALQELEKKHAFERG